jgi:NitT/TauT family transport system substrate-binding protein
MHARYLAFVIVAAMLAATPPAAAADLLKITVGQRGNWDTSISHLGEKAGIFKKHGIELEIIYTSGSGETLQPVIAGSADLGFAVGTQGAMAAYAKGAPVRIIGAEITGAGDLFWYVKGDSPLKSLKDAKTIAYSTNGSSTHGIVTAFIKQYDLKAKPLATGGPPATLTQVMSDQIDVGWSAPPIGLDLLDQGRIRLLATGNDTLFKDQTVRLLLATVQTLQTRKAAIDAYMRGYRETIEWMYADPAALKTYAEFAGISETMAKRIREGFFPKESISPDTIKGLDIIVKDAVALKFTPTELTKEQLAEMIQIPPR